MADVYKHAKYWLCVHPHSKVSWGRSWLLYNLRKMCCFIGKLNTVYLLIKIRKIPETLNSIRGFVYVLLLDRFAWNVAKAPDKTQK